MHTARGFQGGAGQVNADMDSKVAARIHSMASKVTHMQAQHGHSFVTGKCLHMGFLLHTEA